MRARPQPAKVRVPTLRQDGHRTMHPQSAHPNLRLVDHPLIAHKLTAMRDRRTQPEIFRLRLREIAMLMAYAVTADLDLHEIDIETPLAPMRAPVLTARDIVVVSILRAGLGMVDGLMQVIPAAREGHIGLYRDHTTKRPVEYYLNLPEPTGGPFILVDPMLATGHSAAAAVDLLKRHGVADADIRLMVLVAAPEGVRTMAEAHPAVPVYTAALDDRLDENAYILPGLGDAGDRMFGTE